MPAEFIKFIDDAREYLQIENIIKVEDIIISFRHFTFKLSKLNGII